MDEINNMCRSFVHDFYAVEDHVGRFDVVHAHDWLASNAAVWIKEGRGRKAVLTMHSTEYGRNGNRFFGGQSTRVQDHERHGTYCADRVITVSNQLKDEISWLYKVPDHKTQMIYNGVNSAGLRLRRGCRRNQAHATPSGRSTRPCCSSAGWWCRRGRTSWCARMPSVLQILSRTPSTSSPATATCEARSTRLAQRLGVAHAVRMLGDRRGRDLHDLFKACDVVAVPSRNEPFGIVILEGWSAHKPVVSTKRGGPAEFVWHGVNGLQVDDTPDSVAWGLGHAAGRPRPLPLDGPQRPGRRGRGLQLGQHRRTDRRRLRQRRLIPQAAGAFLASPSPGGGGEPCIRV